MFIFLNIFSYLLAIFFLMIILVLILIQNLIGNQKKLDLIIKKICRMVPFVFGIKVKTTTMDHYDPDKQYVFIANHINIFDGFILYGYIPHFIRGVELDTHFTWPVWGTIVKQLGNIPISHKNTKAAVESLNQAARSISNGVSIIILPEGHRTRDGQLQNFSRGAFRLAKYADVDIIPLAMKGSWERKTVHSLFVKPGTIDLISGKIISSKEFKDSSEKEIRDKAFHIIQNMLK